MDVIYFINGDGKTDKGFYVLITLLELFQITSASRPARLKKRVDVLPYGVKEDKSIFLSVKEIFNGAGPGRKS